MVYVRFSAGVSNKVVCRNDCVQVGLVLLWDVGKVFWYCLILLLDCYSILVMYTLLLEAYWLFLNLYLSPFHGGCMFPLIFFSPCLPLYFCCPLCCCNLSGVWLTHFYPGLFNFLLWIFLTNSSVLFVSASIYFLH